MERSYIGVNFPNLVSIAIMLGVIVGLYFAVRKIGLVPNMVSDNG